MRNQLNVSASKPLKDIWREPQAPGKEASASVPTDLEAHTRATLAKPYWDYEEAALVLHLDVKTLRNMKWKREITFTKFGRKVYFSRDAILKELRQNTVLSPTAAARRKLAAMGAGAA
jgi:hypothetical protein